MLIMPQLRMLSEIPEYELECQLAIRHRQYTIIAEGYLKDNWYSVYSFASGLGNDYESIRDKLRLNIENGYTEDTIDEVVKTINSLKHGKYLVLSVGDKFDKLFFNDGSSKWISHANSGFYFSEEEDAEKYLRNIREVIAYID